MPPAGHGTQKVYHLQTAPGDLAPYILTSGSTHRIRRLASFFDAVQCDIHNREFLTITGTYKNIPVTGLATGIGSVIAFTAKRTNYRFLSVSTGFSAGVMLYVSFVEIFYKGGNALAAAYGRTWGD